MTRINVGQSGCVGVARRHSARAVIAVLALSGAVVSLVQTVVLPLLPMFPRALGVSASAASWLATSSIIAGAAATPVLGRLGDLHGKRRVMVGSLAVLAAGSSLCAASSTLPPLLLGRVLQGASIGLVPLAISALHDLFDDRQVGVGLALISATLGIGPGIGLPVAGLFAQWFGWQAVFWLSAGVAAVALALVVAIVPAPDVGRGGGTIDALGAIGLGVALVAALLVLSRGQAWGWLSAPAVGFGLVAVGAAGGWWHHELRHPAPLVELDALLCRPVLLTNCAGLLLGVGMFANGYLTTAHVLIPRSVDHGFGASLVVAGLCMLPGTIVMALLAGFSPWLSRVGGAHVTLATGAAVVAAGFLMRCTWPNALWQIIVGAGIVSAGIAIAYGSMPAIVLANVDPRISASSTAMGTVARAIGASIGSAAAAAVLTTMTVSDATDAVPSLLALRVVAAIAATCASAAVALAWWCGSSGPQS